MILSPNERLNIIKTVFDLGPTVPPNHRFLRGKKVIWNEPKCWVKLNCVQIRIQKRMLDYWMTELIDKGDMI